MYKVVHHTEVKDDLLYSVVISRDEFDQYIFENMNSLREGLISAISLDYFGDNH